LNISYEGLPLVVIQFAQIVRKEGVLEEKAPSFFIHVNIYPICSAFLLNLDYVACFLLGCSVLEGYKSLTRVLLSPPAFECVEFKNRFVT